MKRSWARRTAELHGELAAVAQTDLRWWLLAGGAAAVEPWGLEGDYVISDATPTGDCFIGYRDAAPLDTIADAIARAKAARIAIGELDGELPDQPLAVTIGPAVESNDSHGRRNGNGHRNGKGSASGNGHRNGNGANGNGHRNGSANGNTTAPADGSAAGIVPSVLDVAAFAIGNHCAIGTLDDPDLPVQLAAVAAGATPLPWRGPTPFVCVSIGVDPIETVRHGHRRAWHAGHGPWLGLGRTAELGTVSTCHLVVDGYGHARITGRIAELMRTRTSTPSQIVLPPLRPVPDAIPLAVAWRELPYPAPRALPLAYALGRVLHRMAGRRAARFSPTFQIPIAPGDRGDPMRMRRRVVAGIVSVRFDDGVPEPYAIFETRARAILAREAAGHGLTTRLIAAARAAPAPLAWKRKSIGATRARWLDRFAEVIGGRACLSKIVIDASLPPSAAVSSPARLATPDDPFGGCVLTILEDSAHSAITVCGSGLAGSTKLANDLIDELLAAI